MFAHQRCLLTKVGTVTGYDCLPWCATLAYFVLEAVYATVVRANLAAL
jgi:hypothetical protein